MTMIPTHKLAQHVADLAKAFHVRVEVRSSMNPAASGAGFLLSEGNKPINQKRLGIVIAKIADETTYAVALHELGHCCSALGMVNQYEGSRTMRVTNRCATMRDIRLQLMEERAAWEWAHHYALEWTDVMSSVERMAMKSYLRGAAEYGVKEPR